MESELGRQGIAFFRTEAGDPVDRLVELHVRSADHPLAAQLAAAVFARRRRLNKIDPRPQVPPPPLWPHDE